MRGIVLLATMMATVAAPWPAQALRLPAAQVPLPSPRPDPADITGAILPEPPAVGMATDPLARGLAALSATDIAAAQAIRDSLPGDRSTAPS